MGVILINVPIGDGGNPSPLGEEQFTNCRDATFLTSELIQMVGKGSVKWFQ